ncbi:uncharacterized protein LOC116194220 isoform X3 [Punica granatum]|uniref:Uncharacterized protein LOC116194220 isoform X3 n=1 Tax=Punica granatum TaxID=22663 RepID=A0A6P8CCS4_PUNGR|nr:uncharacterized protein LOC116194220 isoform X3 [Punica granatum]
MSVSSRVAESVWGSIESTGSAVNNDSAIEASKLDFATSLKYLTFMFMAGSDEACISCLARTSRGPPGSWTNAGSRRSPVSPAAGPYFRLWENLGGRRSTSVFPRATVPVTHSFTMS